MTDHPVTAVGRMLEPKHGEPQIRRQLKIHADGSITVKDLPQSP